jgi:hypothetical protein
MPHSAAWATPASAEAVGRVGKEMLLPESGRGASSVGCGGTGVAVALAATTT